LKNKNNFYIVFDYDVNYWILILITAVTTKIWQYWWRWKHHFTKDCKNDFGLY